MKRLFGFLCVLFLCVSVFGGNPVKILSGKQAIKTIFSEKETSVLEFDWKDARYDNDKNMKEEWGDKYDYFVKSCEENFQKSFNKESRGLTISEKQEAKYKIIVKVKNLDKYFNVMNIVPGHTVKIWGDVTVVSQNGEDMVKIEVEEMKGSRDSSPEDCYGKAFYILGERIAKLK